MAMLEAVFGVGMDAAGELHPGGDVSLPDVLGGREALGEICAAATSMPHGAEQLCVEQFVSKEEPHQSA
jgi:hypothetical protein